MNDQMTFPKTFDEFAETYSFKDKEELYTNGSNLIPVFRVKQWLEHEAEKDVRTVKPERIDVDEYKCPLCNEVTKDTIYWEKYKNDWIMKRYKPQYCSHCGAKFIIITNEDKHKIAEKLKQASDAMSSDITEQEFASCLKEKIKDECLNATWRDIIETLAFLVEPEERHVKKHL